MIDERLDRILKFWFKDITEKTVLNPQSVIAKRSFSRDESLDAEVLKECSSELHKARKRKLEQWLSDPKGRLGQVILFDQCSRAIFKDTEKAYENDLRALEIALLMIKDRDDEKLSLLESQFIYMPLMHAESKKIQERSLKNFEMLASEAEKKDKKNVPYFQYVLGMAKACFNVIGQFDRFPQRNVILGRSSTPAELEYLKDPQNKILGT